MKKLLIVLVSILILGGCNKVDSNQKLQDIINENNYIVVDVRTKDEYNEGHVKDALNIPYEEIGENVFDKSKTILVYCKSGKRSKIAYDTLIKNGYKAYDLGAYENIKDFEKVK